MEVCLVDGVGRPRVVVLPDDGELPVTIPQDIPRIKERREPSRRVLFHRVDGLVVRGLQVYLQEETGAMPPVRDSYFRFLDALRTDAQP